MVVTGDLNIHQMISHAIINNSIRFEFVFNSFEAHDSIIKSMSNLHEGFTVVIIDLDNTVSDGFETF